MNTSLQRVETKDKVLDFNTVTRNQGWHTHAILIKNSILKSVCCAGNYVWSYIGL